MPEVWPLLHCLGPLLFARYVVQQTHKTGIISYIRNRNLFSFKKNPYLWRKTCTLNSSTQVSFVFVFRSHLKAASLIIRPISRCASSFKRASFSQFLAHPSPFPGADSILLHNHVRAFGQNTGGSAGSEPQVGRNDSTKSDINLREAAQRSCWRCGEFYRKFDLTLLCVLKMKTF